jgi:two-component system sensor histidine kinase CpxA
VRIKRRLFWKLFFSFCVTVAALLSFLAAIDNWSSRQVGEMPKVPDFLSVYARSAVAQYELAGQGRLLYQLREWSNPFLPFFYLVDSSGRELSGNPVPPAVQTSFPSIVFSKGRPVENGPAQQHIIGKWVIYDVEESGTRGRYHFAVVFSYTTLFAKAILVYLGVISIYAVLAMISCALLALYFTRPIAELRAATGRLAAGDLEARVGGRMAKRGDEIGDLVRDFNAMAERVRLLVQSHKQLLSDVSHELRSPLARQRVALALVQQRGIAEQRPMLERIRAESVRLDELIGRILLLAKLEGGEDKPAMAEFSLNDVVDQIVDDAGFEAQRTGRTVTYSFRREGITIWGNEELLGSAIENVVRNALKYARSGPVEVQLSSSEEAAVISVRDQGPGIPDAELTRIFRPFYRADSSLRADHEGAGLGLAIAQRAVNLHGGSINVRNLMPNGLDVEIRLPATPIPRE